MADDRDRSPRVGRVRRALVTAVAVIAASGSAGCRADSTPATPTTRAIAPAAVPALDAQAIRATVDEFNAAAGTPSDQRQRLADLVDPDRRDEVEQCAAATSTVRFEPVYAGLRRLGGDPDTAATTQTYALPTLIRIYSGERRTGTDLTTLQLVVKSATGGGGPEAYLTPFCVN